MSFGCIILWGRTLTKTVYVRDFLWKNHNERKGQIWKVRYIRLGSWLCRALWPGLAGEPGWCPRARSKMGLIRAGEHAQDMTAPKHGPRYIAHQPSAALAATRAQVGTGSPRAQSQEQPRPARIRRPPPPSAAMQVGRCPCPGETEKCSVCLFISLKEDSHDFSKLASNEAYRVGLENVVSSSWSP